MEHYVYLLWLVLITHFLTKTKPYNNVDGEYHIIKLESCRTSLVDYYRFILHMSSIWNLRAKLVLTYTRTCTQIHTSFADKNDFKKSHCVGLWLAHTS